jgi:hypothetical protein
MNPKIEESILILMQKNEATVEFLQEWLSKASWNTMETIGVASVVANIYNGIETILELLIRRVHEREISGNEWHKAVILTAHELGYVPDEILDVINGMRDFRHVKRHGYDLELDSDMIRANAPEAVRAHDIITKSILEIHPSLRNRRREAT